MNKIDINTVLYYFTTYTLSDDLNYTVDTVIDDVSVIMYFGYNSRLGKRWISIETNNGSVVLERTFLDFGREILFNINADLLGINNATLMLYSTDPTQSGDILNWSKNCKLLVWGIYSYLADDYEKSLVQAKVT